MGVTTTVIAFAFLRRELNDSGIVVNPTKTVALPRKEHTPTAEEGSLLESADVRIAGKGGVAVFGVPIGTYVLERAAETVKDEGANRLAHCMANIPDKQVAAFIAIESFGQRTRFLVMIT